jgi:hypothetical protein
VLAEPFFCSAEFLFEDFLPRLDSYVRKDRKRRNILGHFRPPQPDPAAATRRNILLDVPFWCMSYSNAQHRGAFD